MSRQYSYTVGCLGAILFGLLAATSVSAQGKTPAPQVVITMAEVTPAQDELYLYGSNFGSAPSVYLAGVQLPLLMSSDGRTARL
jgi:hypothetical protein